MSLLWAGLIVVLVAASAISAMLFVRRTAPDGSYFKDGDRASGVFGVLSTGFAILLGFVVFLAFASYDTSRSGAEAEAQIVAQQIQTAQLLPVAAREAAVGGARLLCAKRRQHGVATDDVRRRPRAHQPVGRRNVPHARRRSSR